MKTYTYNVLTVLKTVFQFTGVVLNLAKTKSAFRRMQSSGWTRREPDLRLGVGVVGRDRWQESRDCCDTLLSRSLVVRCVPGPLTRRQHTPSFCRVITSVARICRVNTHRRVPGTSNPTAFRCRVDITPGDRSPRTNKYQHNHLTAFLNNY